MESSIEQAQDHGAKPAKNTKLRSQFQRWQQNAGVKKRIG
jgi:hypothetical protein